MIALDALLWDFLKGNIVTLGLALGILKSLAVAIPSVSDNKVFKLFEVVLKAVTGLRKKNSKPVG